jgi:BirA family transcriptional regulator, biotin operon repressor / biotin---[acetyl-CoA-carboxylase] ligase
MLLRRCQLHWHHAGTQAMSVQSWNVPALRVQLGAYLPGVDVQVVSSIGSTNTALLAKAKSGARHSACLLVAEHQTQGRGRMGRAWSAAAGASLTFSLSLAMDRPCWSGLSLAVGVALAEALDPQRSGIALKWPNDLVWTATAPYSAKLGGILIDTCAAGPQRVAVIGIGLNVTQQPLETFDQAHANLQTLLPGIDAAQTLQRIVQPLVRALQQFAQHGFAPFEARYAQRDMLRGKPITTTQTDVPQGIAQGISSTGALQVCLYQGGPLYEITHGEISVRLSAPETTPC